LALPTRLITADRGDAGRRLDLVLRRHLTDLPRATRTRVQAWIASERVRVNGAVVARVAARVAFGDAVSVELPDEEPPVPVLAEAGPLDCLYEDEHLLIVGKPAGIVSHPTFRHPSGSLLNRVLAHAQGWPAGQRPSLVGRLDKHTSGAVLIAKTAEAHARLQRTLASSFSEKTYLAVVFGPVTQPRGTIDLPLGRDPDDRRRVVAVRGEGLPSLTRFERVDEAEVGDCRVALVRCQLVTGRMHQIRVHLAARGWPIVGDAKYGDSSRSTRVVFDRQALHAWRLAFDHPFTNTRVVVHAPVPEDMQALLDMCGLAAAGTM